MGLEAAADESRRQIGDHLGRGFQQSHIGVIDIILAVGAGVNVKVHFLEQSSPVLPRGKLG